MKKTPTRQLLEIYAQIEVKNSGRNWKKALSHLKSVEINLSKSVNKVNLKHLKPKVKNCYLNALAVCIENENVEYVEGYIEVHGVPLDHAWNCYEGIHFDITQELLSQDNKQFLNCPHQAIMIISATDVMKFALETEIAGPYLYEWLVRQK